ncbi:interferon-induced protein 44-like isoform X1 [Ursus arctos]|uniref:interferon-induced protein 44-like isoform X1 n=2 Tax=Ursus arctos TaxID=9644 RepID=UPI00254764AB|nr:interferon-induced protein 44-like isoform X1 [Ursus arctos]XP_044239645.2 interferon-induced protein 44-like isoform X1 [Ursus arctos]XP_057166522.1 interferon-induced protein 44-like isoform X1 [Ursus arctos]
MQYRTMAVTTRLTWSEEKSLQKMLGNVSLRLLYKSSVHENKTSSILDKCTCQGPTVTIIYIRNTTVGVFMLGPYSKTYDHLKRPNPSFYFSYQRNIATEMRTAVLETETKIASGQLVFYSSGQEVLSVCLNDTKLSINDSLSKALGVYNRSDISYLECEVFRVEGIEDDTNYIRKITRAMKHRNPLLSELRTYKPCVDFVSKVRILLLGPVGSGKSSFINSVKSVFQGRLTRQAAVGSDVTSITEQYRIYPIRDGKYGDYLPFSLCDSMGLHEKEGVGLCMDDIPYILKGCIPDRYQLNPNKPITPNHPNFISTPSLKDSIHCVAYVMDINSINDLSSKMVAKLKQVQKEVLSCGRACVLLLTKVTNCSEFLQDNSLKMDKPVTSQSQIMHVSKMLSVPIYNTFMVENYTSEWELDPLKDTQILFVLRQMLRVAEDFFEDLP